MECLFLNRANDPSLFFPPFQHLFGRDDGVPRALSSTQVWVNCSSLSQKDGQQPFVTLFHSLSNRKQFFFIYTFLNWKRTQTIVRPSAFNFPISNGRMKLTEWKYHEGGYVSFAVVSFKPLEWKLYSTTGHKWLPAGTRNPLILSNLLYK